MKQMETINQSIYKKFLLIFQAFYENSGNFLHFGKALTETVILQTKGFFWGNLSITILRWFVETEDSSQRSVSTKYSKHLEWLSDVNHKFPVLQCP